jgi:hypothetical protein
VQSADTVAVAEEIRSDGDGGGSNGGAGVGVGNECEGGGVAMVPLANSLMFDSRFAYARPCTLLTHGNLSRDRKSTRCQCLAS